MENYHRHTCGSNIFTGADSAATIEQYAKRAVEIGHKTLSGVEHGWQGKYHETREAAIKYGLKFIFGTEAYWVKDRKIPDKTNSHIIILAKNENGRQEINEILSCANETGYYVKPRVDLELLLSLTPSDVFITTACVAFWKYDDINDIVLSLFSHFKDNFMLEIQYHNTKEQIELNKKIKELSYKHGIKMIVGLDSHYIYPYQSVERDELLASKCIHYPDENGWYMDYPDDKTTFERFKAQGVFSDEEIQEAMDNSDVVLEFEDYKSQIFEMNRKLPTLYPGKTQEEKNKIYSRLITKLFLDYMKNIPKEEYQRYYDGVKMEVDTYKNTGMVDYPLLDYEIIRLAKERGGMITRTGRGCFTADAMITTSSGIKHLNEVKIGDKVIDKDGVFQTVTNVMEYDCDEELIKLVYSYCSIDNHPLICTKDHKILINRNGTTSWVEAGEIKSGDKVCSPKIDLCNQFPKTIDLNEYNIFGYDFDDEYIYEKRPANLHGSRYSSSEISKHVGCSKSAVKAILTESVTSGKYVGKILQYLGCSSIKECRNLISDSSTLKIKRFINVDELFNTWVGLMYGDGTVRGDKNRTDVCLHIATYGRKKEINKKVFIDICNRLNVEYKVQKNTKRRVETILFYSKVVNEFAKNVLFSSKLGAEKHFNEQFFMQSEENRRALIRGLELSDGCMSSTKYTSFDNTSKSIIGAYRILVASVGENITSMVIRNNSNDKNLKESYKIKKILDIDKNTKRRFKIESDEKYFYLPVHKIVSIPASNRKVYDITVENSHSYMLDNIIVHNSAVGYFTNTLCGFSSVDRFQSPIKLYPERFISETRIIESNSLPD